MRGGSMLPPAAPALRLLRLLLLLAAGMAAEERLDWTQNSTSGFPNGVADAITGDATLDLADITIFRALAGPSTDADRCVSPTGQTDHAISTMQEHLCGYAREVVRSICCDGIDCFNNYPVGDTCSAACAQALDGIGSACFVDDRHYNWNFTEWDDATCPQPCLSCPDFVSSEWFAQCNVSDPTEQHRFVNCVDQYGREGRDSLCGEMPATHRICPIAACNLTVVDCVGNWTPWSNCSQHCGGGVRERRWEQHVAALNGGLECPYADNYAAIEQCNSHPCGRNCEGAWSEWTNCSETCGGGLQQRTYTVSVFANAFGGTNATCDENVNETVAIQTCSPDPCPTTLVHGRVSFALDSVPEGQDRMVFEESFRASVAAMFHDIEEDDVTVVSISAGSIIVEFTIEVDSRHADDLTDTVNGSTIEIEVPISGIMQQVSSEPVSAAVGSPPPLDAVCHWSEWSQCNATCGGGSQDRVYEEISPAVYGGRNCSIPADTVAYQSCNSHPCTINCVGGWGTWTDCSRDCIAMNGDVGTQIRTFQVVVQAEHGGTECIATHREQDVQECNVFNCPVDAVCGWGDWDECTSTCGGGTQQRFWTELQPPAFG
eukprot:SAG31_NODE_442_length_15661_cov_4.132245_1_plen_601_part_10